MRSTSPHESLSGKTVPSSSTVPRSRELDGSLKTESRQRNGAPKRESTFETGTNQHKPADRSRSRIPTPQRVRIIQKYFAGKNISQLAREENRNRETVARIVKEDEVREVVQQMKTEYYGLLNDAVAAVRHALQQQKDARIGYRILADTGVIPTPEEALTNAMQAEEMDPEKLTPLERAIAQDDSGRINPLLLEAVRMGVGTDAMFASLVAHSRRDLAQSNC